MKKIFLFLFLVTSGVCFGSFFDEENPLPNGDPLQKRCCRSHGYPDSKFSRGQYKIFTNYFILRNSEVTGNKTKSSYVVVYYDREVYLWYNENEIIDSREINAFQSLTEQRAQELYKSGTKFSTLEHVEKAITRHLGRIVDDYFGDYFRDDQKLKTLDEH